MKIQIKISSNLICCISALFIFYFFLFICFAHVALFLQFFKFLTCAQHFFFTSLCARIHIRILMMLLAIVLQPSTSLCPFMVWHVCFAILIASRFGGFKTIVALQAPAPPKLMPIAFSIHSAHLSSVFYQVQFLTPLCAESLSAGLAFSVLCHCGASFARYSLFSFFCDIRSCKASSIAPHGMFNPHHRISRNAEREVRGTTHWTALLALTAF